MWTKTGLSTQYFAILPSSLRKSVVLRKDMYITLYTALWMSTRALTFQTSLQSTYLPYLVSLFDCQIFLLAKTCAFQLRCHVKSWDDFPPPPAFDIFFPLFNPLSENWILKFIQKGCK